jgi:hypothetical protein
MNAKSADDVHCDDSHRSLWNLKNIPAENLACAMRGLRAAVKRESVGAWVTQANGAPWLQWVGR